MGVGHFAFRRTENQRRIELVDDFLKRFIAYIDITAASVFLGWNEAITSQKELLIQLYNTEKLFAYIIMMNKGTDKENCGLRW